MTDVERITQVKAWSAAQDRNSSLRPFHYTAFTVLRTATLFSNIGMDAERGSPLADDEPRPESGGSRHGSGRGVFPYDGFRDPVRRAADTVDHRKLLIVGQIAATVLIAVLGYMIWLEQFCDSFSSPARRRSS